ncbi:methyltransferase domain-containing protein [Diaphorobacter sp. HDW4A]|uniref:methyltransferase domain-containing protein n=1 Tax=Diaphorobacter sp. HDW4A TaxID=2714924 RepID=UPI00140CDCA9|nr:methyltransferase domain-containing protein [Diaphorobacter sp. HDW4A]QIL81852.1 methyltransferase domain-containing protein [Diaphorobacter sp. HDW4A]
MTQNIEDLHVYLRKIRPGERTSLSVIASLVHQNATVLDLGCGSGALGQYLKETLGCTSDGLTWSEAEAAHARPNYGQVEVADLETCDLLTLFTNKHYDYIVCADVLEHLRQPERILAACRKLLKPEGKLLVSVPNAGYAGLVAELLQGEFRYREEGLLDRTHLRFFTRRSLARFLGENAWRIDVLDTVRRELPESEFKTQFDDLPPAVARYLLATPDALAYQFIGAAHPVVEAVTDNPDQASDHEPAHALFTTQLYVDLGNGYAEDTKISATGAMGEDRQRVKFEIPVADSPLSHLRLDPADRPGFLYLYSIVLRAANGDALWSWSPDQADNIRLAKTPQHQILWQPPAPRVSSATVMLLTGDDPWLELPLVAARLADALQQTLTLELDVGWPMSADYLAMAHQVQPLHSHIDQLSTHVGDLNGQIVDLNGQINTLNGETSSLSHSLAASENQRRSFQDESAQFQRNATRLEHELVKVQGEFKDLAAHLKGIENSTVFKATRPLVNAKIALDRLRGRAPKHEKLKARQFVQTTPATPIAPTTYPVDVIVPVYRGLADTQLCVESVLAAPVQVPYRLIVINDCSPEPEVTNWLRERAAGEPRIMLLENEENLGFVGTVNRGMALSDANDVLLLNSDTEVANNWLDRIRAAAYGDKKIASVTPFSTNATICSYPRFCEDNPLPPGYSTARMDALCAKTNPGAVVDVPTGVGFCMYIRRDSLKDVGLFDVKNFGKGYGEENDFCQRAEGAGWRNLHLLDTFVLHTGGVSFGDSKSPRERAAMEKLARLHPSYASDVHKFVQADPARPYRLALDVARIRDANQPVILAVLHDRAGGTVRHVRELAEHLTGKAVFLTLTPSANKSLTLRMASEAEGFDLVFKIDEQFDDLLNVLSQLYVSHVHFHHLLGHDKHVRDIPALLNVTYDFTAHDFYSYCTYITITGEENRYQGEISPGQCKCCTPDMPAPTEGNVARWRGANARFLSAARTVITPSHDTAKRIIGFAPAANVHAIQHTDIDASVPLPTPAPQPITDGRALRIVVLGALSAIKGADVLEAAAVEAARQGTPVEFHLLGYGYRHLLSQPKAALSVHGAYKEEELPQLLAWLKPDLIWFPAQWPETYSYTLSAALQAGLPVVVPDIGAFAERVVDRPWTWIHEWDRDAKEWVDFFEQIRKDNFAPAIAPSLESAQPNAPKTPEADGWTYQSDYFTHMSAPSEPAADAAPLEGDYMAQFVPERAYSGATKAGILGMLVYLRSLPVLRGVARKIPPQFQRQVKTWLNG